MASIESQPVASTAFNSQEKHVILDRTPIEAALFCGHAQFRQLPVFMKLAHFPAHKILQNIRQFPELGDINIQKHNEPSQSAC